MASSPSPSIVIVGTGWGINIQVPAFQHAGWTIEAIVAKSDAHAIIVRQKVPNIPIVTDLASYLSNVSTSTGGRIVSVTTPPATHHDLAKQVLSANTHCLCEKPFALTAAQAQSMVDTAAQHPRSMAIIDHELRVLKAVQRARERVLAPEFGPVHSLTIVHYGPLAVKPVYNWWSDSSAGGGLLGALGSHMIDLAMFLTNSHFTSVSCQLHIAIKDKRDESTGEDREVTSDDYCALTAMAAPSLTTISAPAHSFPVSMSLSGNAAVVQSKKVVVGGQHQSLELDLQSLAVTLHGPDRESSTVICTGDEDYQDSEIDKLSLPKNPFTAGTVILARRLKAVITGKEQLRSGELATFEDGLAIQRVLDAAYQSHREGRRVELHPPTPWKPR